MGLTEAQTLTIITALVAAIPGFVALLVARAKTKAETKKAGAEAVGSIADAAGVVADTAMKLLPVLQQRVADLDNEVAILRTAQEKQVAITKALECQVEEMKVTIAQLVRERDSALEKIKEQP